MAETVLSCLELADIVDKSVKAMDKDPLAVLFASMEQTLASTGYRGCQCRSVHPL